MLHPASTMSARWNKVASPVMQSCSRRSYASGERAPASLLLQFGHPILVTSEEDKVGRLAACKAFLLPEERRARQAAAMVVVVVVEPDAQQAAAVAAEPGAQWAVAVADAQPGVAVEPVAQRVAVAVAAAAAESVAQCQAAVSVA